MKKIREIAKTAQVFLVVELSTGQMVDDVKLALNGMREVKFYGRCGGMVPSAEEIIEQVKSIFEELEKEIEHQK